MKHSFSHQNVSYASRSPRGKEILVYIQEEKIKQAIQKSHAIIWLFSIMVALLPVSINIHI